MKNNWTLYVLVCLGLGLAPWWLKDEPHIIGKVRWVLGGAKGMQVMDYFDLLLHGSPWLFLVWKAIQEFVLNKNKR